MVLCFSAGDANRFALTLERILGILQEPRTAFARSPFNELITPSELRTVVNLARGGEFEWLSDQKGGVILRSGIGRDTLVMLGNLDKVEPPADPPGAVTCPRLQRSAGWASIPNLGKMWIRPQSK